MEFAVLGWPAAGPTLALEYTEFPYAGKFRMSNTGKAVARTADSETVLAAVAFDEHRTEESTICLRYVTVRSDRRGEAIAPRLVRRQIEEIRAAGYETVRIGVNNPFSYHAMFKAGFGYTGTQAGLADLILSTSADRSRYAEGLRTFREREDLADSEREFIEDHAAEPPPGLLEPM